MSADFRYMKCPRQTWFLVYTIPPALRSHPRFMTATGRPMDKITESLGTKDPDVAREKRNERIAYWDKQFRTMRHGPSEEDIEHKKIEIYRRSLAGAESLLDGEDDKGERGYFQSSVQAWKEKRMAGRRVSFDELQDLMNEEPPPISDYREALDIAIRCGAAREIEEFGNEFGVVLEPQTERYREIGINFLKAKLAAGDPDAWLPLPDGRELMATEEVLAPPGIEPPIPIEPKPATAPPPPKKGAETFAEAAAIYLKNELRDDVKPATVQEYRRKIDAFPHKDKPLRTITRGMAADFLDGLPVSKRTRNLYAALLSAIYKSAIRRDKANANPFDGQRLRGVAQVHYEPFTDQELATLFADAKFEVAPDKHTTATALPWASLIAAFTGCRRDEIARLMVSDIKQTGRIWFFDIRDGKTENAKRVVPVHHALIDAGLLRYRDALPRSSRLFPSLKAPPSAPDKIGKKLSYAFEAWRKRLGIERKGVVFHSFRHTVGDRLRKAGVAKDDRGFLLGHADVEMQNKVYGHDGPGLRRLKDIVEKIDYSSVEQR